MSDGTGMSERYDQVYGTEARRRYGEELVNAANERLRAMSDGEWRDVVRLGLDIKSQLRKAMATGDPRGDEARELARMHARWLAAHWPEGMYTVNAHRELVNGYLRDRRFIDFYDGDCGEGATEFLRDAVMSA